MAIVRLAPTATRALSTFALVAACAVAGCSHGGAKNGADAAADADSDRMDAMAEAGSDGTDAPADVASDGVDAAPDATSDASDAAADLDSDGMDAGPACVPAGDAASAAPPDAGLVLVADTQVGFSGTQGSCSWSYGYRMPATDGGFQLMTDWDPGYPAWWAMRGTYWTLVAADRQHANGATTTGGRSPVEQWSVRRWTSTVAGTITISGAVRKVPTSEGGNGIDARIFVDGVEKYSHFIDAADTTGVSFVFSAAVVAGSTVDFVLDPHQSNDSSDTTFFAAQIWK